MNSPSHNLPKKIGAVILLLSLVVPTTAFAAPFCDEVLDSFDFEVGVFAGPDPDHLPTRINDYVSRRVQHQVDLGELTSGEAEFFLEIAMEELHLFRSIAQTCQREPQSDIRLIDRLLEPHLKGNHVREEQTDRANALAEESLVELFHACQEFWMETDAGNPCPPNVLEQDNGNALPGKKEMQIEIINGGMTTFEARARHHNGTLTYHVTADGVVTEVSMEGK